MGTVIGFALGYALGVKAAPAHEELRKAWQDIAASAEFKELTAGAAQLLQQALQHSETLAAGPVALLSAGNADLLSAWKRMAQSPEVRALISDGMSLLGRVLEQGGAPVAQPSSGRRAAGAR